jgi:hypothetical protein
MARNDDGSFDFPASYLNSLPGGKGKKPRARPRFKPTAAQRAAYQRYHGKGKKK